MAIAFRCGQCGRIYEVDDSLAGKRGKCKDCGAVFAIPEPGAVDDPYGLDDPYALSSAPEPDAAEEPGPSPRPKGKKKKRRGSAFWPSNLSPWGYRVYIGAIAVAYLASLLTYAKVKLILALLGGFLCMGPLIAAGFAQSYAIPFRDGIATGLLYMFVFPYRVHYRLTHREEFARAGLPSFTLRDRVPLILALPGVGLVFLAANEVDNMARAPRRPNPVVVHRPAGPPDEAAPAPPRKPIEEARKKAGAPELKGPGSRKHERPEPEPDAPRIARIKRAPARPFTSPKASAASSAFEQREAIARDVRARMEDVVAAIAAVVDPASARDAAPRLRAIAQALDDAQRRLDRIPRLSAEDDARLRAIHDDALRAAAARFTDEAARVGSIPGVAPILNHDLQAFRPFVPGTDIRLVLATPKPAMPAMPAPPPAAGADSALTINVGNTDGPTNRAINAALMEMLKAEGNNWSLRSNSAGGRTWFTVSPVGDPRAFADRLPFAREAKVSGRTIDVVVDPAKVAGAR